MINAKNILVATDFSEGARAALIQAARFASATDARLHVLHVASGESMRDLRALFPEAGPAVESYLHDAARERLEPELQAAGLAKAPEVQVVVGHPAKEIFAAIERVGADLLVIGATGKSDRRMGTVAGRCVRKAQTKVMLVPKDMSGPFKRIVACVDFSELSPLIVRQAAHIARLDGGAVTAVYVYDVPDVSPLLGAVESQITSLTQQYPALMQKRFDDELAAHAGDVDVTFELITSRDYSRGIVDYATRQESDLVVTGTTGRSGIAYALLGTTAEKVMRDVGCAVLAIKADSAKAGSAGG